MFFSWEFHFCFLFILQPNNNGSLKTNIEAPRSGWLVFFHQNLFLSFISGLLVCVVFTFAFLICLFFFFLLSDHQEFDPSLFRSESIPNHRIYTHKQAFYVFSVFLVDFIIFVSQCKTANKLKAVRKMKVAQFTVQHSAWLWRTASGKWRKERNTREYWRKLITVTRKYVFLCVCVCVCVFDFWGGHVQRRWQGRTFCVCVCL